MSHSQNGQPNWFARHKVLTAIIGSFLVITVVGALSEDLEQKQEASVVSEPVSAITEDSRTASTRSIARQVVSVLGEKNLSGKTTLRGVEFVEHPIEPEKYELKVDFMAQSYPNNQTPFMTHNSMTELAKAITPRLGEEVYRFRFTAHLSLVDVYGTESVEEVMSVGMERETWEKITWENFSFDRLPDVADHYWMHPAIR